LACSGIAGVVVGVERLDVIRTYSEMEFFYAAQALVSLSIRTTPYTTMGIFPLSKAIEPGTREIRVEILDIEKFL